MYNYPIVKNFGLIEVEPTPEDYILGASNQLSSTVIFESGHGWGDYLPEKEFQFSTKTDFMDCVTESAQNCIEFIVKKLYGQNWNKSGRYTAKLSNTTKEGNNQTNVAESIRKIDGLIDEAKLPRTLDMTWEEFYAPIPEELQVEGKDFITTKWKINHEWVSPNKDAYKEALKYSPIQAIGYAWARQGDIYYDFGRNANHAFVVFDYKEGEYWMVYDSYPTDNQLDPNKTEQEFIKKLDWNYKFGWGKRFNVSPITPEEPIPSNNIITNVINMIKKKYIVLFHGNEADKSKNTGTYWFLKKLDDGIVYRQQMQSIGAIMMFIWVFVDALIRAISNGNSGEVPAIKNTDWGEIGSYPETSKMFGSNDTPTEED